jgi:8-oxo-dGTP pyrophosphatase MutT (NUDIX family)
MQRGDDLGARLEGVAEDLLASGAKAVAIVDSDTPTLPVAFLEEAINALQSDAVDVVLGPAQDGGYYLVGLRAPQPSLFRGIPWSTSSVLRASLHAADASGLRVHLLQSWYDVDEPPDLDRLVRQLRTLSPFVPGFPRETARLLSDQAFADHGRNELWTTRSTRPVYGNRWMDVAENVVTLPSGHVTLYGVVRTSPCVGVVPLIGGARVLLVRQFRYVARRFTWEIPTGGVHPGETLEEAARRELREEAAVEARTLRPLLSFDTSKSVVEETAHLFVATVDTIDHAALVPAQPDDTEDIERRIFSIEEVHAMVIVREIVDSMSLLALLAMRAGVPDTSGGADAP